MTTPVTVLGTNAEFVVSTTPTLNGVVNANNPALVIYFSDIKSSIQWDTAITNNIEPWIASILQLLANYTALQEAAEDETSMIPTRKDSQFSQTTRNGANKKLVSYQVETYTQLSVNASIDGDEF
jgi:hypothetical protein